MVQWKNVNVDGIYRLCHSPCGSTLVSLHFSGKLSLWELPSLRLKKSFELTDQPGWDEINPLITENPAKQKRLKDLIPHKQLLDVNFWSDNVLILARCTGAVSVVSPDDFHNLLGKSPEWYEPSPQLTPAQNGGFLGLECEIRFPEKRIIMPAPEVHDDDGDDSDEEDASLVSKMTCASKQVLYYLTDSERFLPPKKKPRYVTKLHRIVHLKSTSPEELYARKIEGEEYGEALALAQAYSLDCDLVYQRQWRQSQVSSASIQDYLSKISKRAWVLHECLERVPDNIDAMKELLEYGLCGTDLPALITVGREEDGGRFILCDPDEGLYEDVYDEFNPESMRQKEEKRAEIRQALIEQVDFSNLNLEQKEMCRARLKFYQYLDRLKVYECLLGGPSIAAERFNAEFYKTFRCRSIFELAVEYAQSNDWRAVEILMTFYSEDIAVHRLAILSNFPETANPSDYKDLLPEICDDDDSVVPWKTDAWRSGDWSEEEQCRKVVDLGSEDNAAFLYKNFKEKYRIKELNPSLVQEWYHERAVEIEQRSRLIDNAIELTKLGIERGVEGLADLLDDLVTMEMMVYECGVSDTLSLAQLREMADYDRLELIMAQSTEEMYTKNLKRWMIPFVQRCEEKEPGAYDRLIRDFVLTRARDDLCCVLKVFEASKAKVPLPVIRCEMELMSLVLDSVYSCERDDQLDVAAKIFECLPLRSRNVNSESPESLRLHKQVDQLDNHLSVARILEAYDMRKTLAYIKSSEEAELALSQRSGHYWHSVKNDPEESRSLMIKLTRLAGRRALPLTEVEWHKLHDDVMLLQNKVYRCISRNFCHEIFVESLLCSGWQDTIRLAGTMLERSCTETKPSRSQRLAGVDKVPYTRAVELILSAAREYFDSSANLSDPCMDLARSCLNLILDAPQAIQEELDLIASLALLDEFGVAILPLQVRLSKNRLELIKKAVTTKPTSYKQHQRLLRLGQLLGISSDDSDTREGLVIQMSAEVAVMALDYEYAYQCCERLISLRYSPSWSVCVRLAEQEGFRNISAKAKLLTFALTYCDEDMIHPVLQARCLLETQIQYEKVNNAVEGEACTEKNTREVPFSARAAIKQTQQILSSTKRTTTAVLSSVTDGKWWQSAVSSLKNPSRVADNMSVSKDDGNVTFKKQGCHPFYASIIDDGYEDMRYAEYNMLTYDSMDAEIILSADILRTSKLEEMLTQGEKLQPATEALLVLARQTMPRDSLLGLAYLMAVPRGSELDIIFQDFPHTDISLQLAIFYYALNVYIAVQPLAISYVYALYRQTPSRIISRVTDYVNVEPGLPPEVKSLVEKMKNYQEMLDNYVQACTLKQLGKGVDVIRFADDSDYKKETILGLAMSVDDEVYDISLSLAKHYNMSLWDVYMCHLEFLFSDSCLSLNAIQARVNKLDILPTLRENNACFIERMMSRVYPLLAGTDLKGLSYFFSLLGTVEEKILHGLMPAEHFALLKKLKPAFPGLDYKKLMEEDTSSLEVLRPCITSSNISTLAKLAPQIPDRHGSFINPSSLYGLWASQLFWMEDESKKTAESMAAWIHRYEALGEWIQKLLPEDFITLVDNISFSASKWKILDVPTREEITKRALKFSRQSSSGKKKKQDSGTMSWEECSTNLQKRLSHLKSLSNDTIQSFAAAVDPVFLSYAKRYDLSKGNFEEVELLLVQMILDGQAMELVDDILQVAPSSSLRVRTVVQQAVNHIGLALRGHSVSHQISVNKPWLEVLQMVAENVKEYQVHDGDLVQAEDVMSLLRSFCSDASIEVTPRLDVLQVLEKSFDLAESDRILLTLYRTDALVKSTWTGVEISEENIISEEARMHLFASLLSDSKNRQQYITLCHLLILWPSLSSSLSFVEKSPWVLVFLAIITKEGDASGKIINHILQNECPVFPLDLKCAEHLFKCLLNKGQTVEGVKLVLQFPGEDLLDQALDVLSSQNKGTEDEELLSLILQKKLSPRVVAMPVYSSLIAHILQAQSQPSETDFTSPTAVAKQLQKAGYLAEAGSLMLQSHSSHSAFHTFASALTVARCWFKE